MDRMIIAVLVLALAYFLLGKFVLASRRPSSVVPNEQLDTQYAQARQRSTALAIVEQIAPSDPDVPITTAAIRRRQGRWREALQQFDRALCVDPRNANTLNEITFTYFAVRDWPASASAADKMLALAPNAGDVLSVPPFC